MASLLGFSCSGEGAAEREEYATHSAGTAASHARDVVVPEPPQHREELADVRQDAPRFEPPLGSDGDETDLEAYFPARYPAEYIMSPISDYVADRLRDLTSGGAEGQPDVFMKVGASGTASPTFLNCFAGTQVRLQGWSELENTRDFFIGGDAAGSSPFDRQSLAAKAGAAAVWALTGEPSPVDEEIEAIAPSIALIAYGTNDMQLGISYQSAIWNFAHHLHALSEHLIARGIVPVLATIPTRGDRPDANHWVPAYNAVIRGIAQSQQIPLLDLWLAYLPLPNYGLSADGLHSSVYRDADGIIRPCHFHDEALEHGTNVRNLITLRMLDRLRRVLVDEVVELDPAGPPNVGDGRREQPFIIDSLPYVHSANTQESPWRRIDRYPGCSDADQGGPELIYRFTTSRTVRIRAMVFDHGDADVDLHLLNAAISPEQCIGRHDRVLHGTLPPGTYHFAVDTYRDETQVERAGAYLFTLTECHPDDASCDAP